MSDEDPICMCGHVRSAHEEALFACEAITCECAAFVNDSGDPESDVIDEGDDIEEPVEPWEQDADSWKT